MRKLIIAMLAALAFVACEKEEKVPYQSCPGIPSEEFLISPNYYDVEAGAVVKINTPIPSFHLGYITMGKLWSTDYDFDPESYPVTYENDYYSLVQTSATSYEITIKDIDESCGILLQFRGKESDIITYGEVVLSYKAK